MPIPETGTRILRVYVIGHKALFLPSVQLLTHHFKRTAQPGQWRSISRPFICPPVAQVAVVEIIGEVRADVGGQGRYPHPGLCRKTGLGSWSAQLVAGEEATDINMVRFGRGDLEIMVGGHEIPLRGKVVVNARSPGITSPREAR